MSFFSALRTSASGLTAQRLRMDVISNNIANAESTRTSRGGAFRRQQIVFSPRVAGLPFARFLRDSGGVEPTLGAVEQGVEVASITEDDSPTRLAYQPGHPDANAEGYVEYPNVNVVTEMTDMISATRSYEANVTVFNAAKAMAQRALEIGRA
ncbi:MAG: flagellar basal body rod protein FlgC [Chloroflexi bacterium]|nr:flagellar basal body rod protein FlgC [Chloroflexota bacterium]